MKLLTLLVFAIAVTGCAVTAPRSDAAGKIQIMRQNNTLAATCKRLAPLSVNVARVAPAQVVHDEAINEIREKAALAGADSLMILNVDHVAGLTNSFSVQAVALKCY